MIQWLEGNPLKLIPLAEGVVKFFNTRDNYGFIHAEDDAIYYFTRQHYRVPSFEHDDEWRWHLELRKEQLEADPDRYADVIFQAIGGISHSRLTFWCFKQDLDDARRRMFQEVKAATDEWIAAQSEPNKNLIKEVPPMVCHLSPSMFQRV
jgi:hypothetical protein